MAEVRTVLPAGMVSLRGDLGSEAVASALREVAGVAVPDRLASAFDGERGALWMSPDELLLLVPDGPAAAARLAELLAGVHHLALDVSDMRAVFEVTGPGAREVIAKLAPVDMTSFGPETVRRTHLGQIAAAVWAVPGGFRVACFRSVGDYMRRLLEVSVAAGPVGHLAD